MNPKSLLTAEQLPRAFSALSRLLRVSLQQSAENAEQVLSLYRDKKYIDSALGTSALGGKAL